jgi:hypothetical protein
VNFIEYQPQNSEVVDLQYKCVGIGDDDLLKKCGFLPNDNKKAIEYISSQYSGIPVNAFQVTNEDKEILKDQVFCNRGSSDCVATYEGTVKTLGGEKIVEVDLIWRGADSCYSYEGTRFCPKEKDGIIVPRIQNFDKTKNEAIEEALEEKGIKGISDNNIQSSDVLGANDSVELNQTNNQEINSSGLYELTIGDKKVKILTNDDKKIIVYNEINGEEGYQDGEDGLIEIDTSSLSKILESKEYAIEEGINILSFPFLPLNENKETLMASQLLSLANQGIVKISQITYFENGKWDGGLKVLSADGDIFAGNDFPIFPGRGYLLIGNFDTTIQIPGLELMSSMPVELASGWNLVGINGYDDMYTADSLIDSMNKISGVTVDNITWWPRDLGMYQGYQKTNGITYSFDYYISDALGYFIRVSDFKSEECKSILWNPDGDMDAKCGKK